MFSKQDIENKGAKYHVPKMLNPCSSPPGPGPILKSADSSTKVIVDKITHTNFQHEHHNACQGKTCKH